MSNGLVGHLQDLFADFGAISTQPMFGGHALYRNAVARGSVLEATLYLKVDVQSRPLFEAAAARLAFIRDSGCRLR